MRRQILIALFLAAALVTSLAMPPQVPAEARRTHARPGPSPSPSQSPTPTPAERIASLTQKIKEDPSDKGAHGELGILLVQTGRPKEGRDELQTALKLGLIDASVWYYIGVADLELSQPFDAIGAFERAENLDPANPAVLSSLADTYARFGRLDDAMRIAKRAVSLHPKEAFAYEALGTVQLNEGKFDEGRKTLQQALAIDPKDTRTKILLGRSYLADKAPRPDLALPWFESILTDDPKNTDALRGKAQALAAKDDINGAAAAYQQVVKLEPDRVEAEIELAQLYLSKNMVDQARQEFAQAVKDHPKAPEPYVAQAEYDANKKNFGQAVQEYQAAIALTPDDLRLRLDYAKTLVMAQRFGPARDELQKVVAAQPDNAEATFWLGQAHAGTGDWARARDAYRKAFDLSRSYQALFNLGLAYFNSKEYRHAREVFEALAAHGPKNNPDAQLWFLLGETDRRMGDKRSAITAYKRFLALVPTGDAAAKARAYIKQLGG